MNMTRFAVAFVLSPLFNLAAPSLSQEAPADGERLFRTRCASCHSIEPDQNRIGPSLAGVFGRQAGKAEGARYSAPLGASDIVWNADTLDAYLNNPRQLVAGTTMTFSLRDGAQREAVIGYLRDSATAPTK